MTRPSVPSTEAHLVEVLDRHRFDEGALTDWLASNLPGGLDGPIALRQFQGGQSNPTFLMTSGSRRLVLRKKPPGVLLPKAHDIEREYRILSAVHGTGVPVPEPLVLCEDPDVIGTVFYVMGHVDGDLHDHPHMPGQTPDRRRAVYLNMARTMARLHQVDWKARGLDGLARTGDFLGRQIKGWNRQFTASNGDRPDPAFDWLRDWLNERKPADAPERIVHGDFRIGNLLFVRGSGEVAALLDWELTTLGDPLSDLAYNSLVHYVAPGTAGIRGVLDLDKAAMGIPEEGEMLETYRAAVGRPDIPDWPFYIVFSLYRLAAIAKGVHARSQGGNASSEDAVVFGAQTTLMIETAIQLADDAR